MTIRDLVVGLLAAVLAAALLNLAAGPAEHTLDTAVYAAAVLAAAVAAAGVSYALRR